MKCARRFWLTWGIGAALWVSTLMWTGPHDLTLSQTWVDTQSNFGWLVLVFGEWPGWVLVAASLFVLIHSSYRPDSALRAYRPLAWAVILLTLLQAGLVTQSIKFFWGRVRFVHLAADLSNYTPFWIPAGVGAGKSFPSGHVAMAFVTAPLPFFFFSHKRSLAAWLSLSLVLIYGGGVACGRILYGSHYVTDVLFSAGLALLAAPLLLHVLDKTGEEKTAPAP